MAVAKRKIEEKNKILSEMDTCKNDYIGMVVHDLRSPLSILSGFTQLLRDDRPSQRLETINLTTFVEIRIEVRVRNDDPFQGWVFASQVLCDIRVCH